MKTFCSISYIYISGWDISHKEGDQEAARPPGHRVEDPLAFQYPQELNRDITWGICPLITLFYKHPQKLNRDRI